MCLNERVCMYLPGSVYYVVFLSAAIVCRSQDKRKLIYWVKCLMGLWNVCWRLTTYTVYTRLETSQGPWLISNAHSLTGCLQWGAFLSNICTGYLFLACVRWPVQTRPVLQTQWLWFWVPSLLQPADCGGLILFLRCSPTPANEGFWLF